MDYKIVAISMLGTHPVPVQNFVARIYGLNKMSLREAAMAGKMVEATLRYRLFEPGAKSEQPRTFKIQCEPNAIQSLNEVVSLRDPNDGKLGIFFFDLGSGQDIINI